MRTDIQKTILERIQYLKKIIAIKQRAVEKAPAGHVKVRTVNGAAFYDFYLSSHDRHSMRYLRKKDGKDRRLIRELIQKGYDQKVLKKAKRELDLLIRVAAFYEQGCAEELYEMLSPGRREFVHPIILTDEEYADYFQKMELKKKKPLQEGEGFKSQRGERVRSKSEVFIANTLLHRDRKYHYECAVEVIDHLTGFPHTVYPDFYVLNPRTRKSYYWEHFGKCDDPAYVNDNINKLIDYRSAGITLGDNLIITLETKTSPFTPEEAEWIIDQYLT